MAYTITNPELGTFVGLSMGMAFWTKLDSAGQTRVTTFDTEEQTVAFINEIGADLFGEAGEDYEIFEVTSGHWEDLHAVGLHFGDMHLNEARMIATHNQRHSLTSGQVAEAVFH